MTDHKEELQILLQLARAISAEDDKRFFMVLYRANETLELEKTKMAASLGVSSNQLELWIRGEATVPRALRTTIFHWIERETNRRLRQISG